VGLVAVSTVGLSAEKWCSVGLVAMVGAALRVKKLPGAPIDTRNTEIGRPALG
jgi:hypothetical protein